MLDEDTPESAQDEPVALQEGGNAGGAEIEDSSPSSEPTSSSRDDTLSERLRSVEAQARIYQEEAERNRRELEALRSAQRPDPREEQARLEAMDPEQRVIYHFDKQAQEFRSNAMASEVRTAAQLDQMKFEAQLDKTAGNLGWSSAQRAKYAGEVESMYNTLGQRFLSLGRPDMIISRGDLLKHKLGDELMATGGKAIRTATDKGKGNISRQTAKMTPASSNVTGKSTGKTKAQESLDRMLQAGVLEM